jgi:hypothetical protein
MALVVMPGRRLLHHLGLRRGRGMARCRRRRRWGGVCALAVGWCALAALHPAASTVSRASPATSRASVNRMELPFALSGLC